MKPPPCLVMFVPLCAAAMLSSCGGTDRVKPIATDDDPTHCRVGAKYSLDDDGHVVRSAGFWPVRRATAADFASLPRNVFRVQSGSGNDAGGTLPPFEITPSDYFINTEVNGVVHVAYTNAESGQSNFSARLTMQRADGDYLWAHGKDITWTGDRGGRNDTVAMFLLPDTDRCRGNAGVRCKRILVEYFHTGDLLASQDFPRSSGPGKNIFDINSRECGDLSFLETSDGEGHEGPP